MRCIRVCLYMVTLITTLLLPTACSSKPELPLLAADTTILAFGDSLTAGTGATESESYPANLARMTGLKVINAGLPGEVSSSGLQRLPQLLEQERPALLLLCHGGNDLLQRQEQGLLRENLRNMLRIAQERGVPVLLIAVPTPGLSLEPPDLYKELAKEFNIPFESKVLPHILGKNSLKSDHVHPNDAGYRLLAEDLVKLLKKSGALPA